MTNNKTTLVKVLNAFIEYRIHMQSSILLAVRETWSLVALGYAGESKFTILKKRTRLATTAAQNSKIFLTWLRYLRTLEFSKYATHNKRLTLKPLRVYMSAHWNMEQRIKVILDTYKVINTSGILLKAIQTGTKGLVIATIPNNDNHENALQIRLGYDNTFRKEGELVLMLWCPQLNGPIISLAFSFEYQDDAKLALYIACVQGGSDADNKTISKLMYGIWPRVFIVFVIQEIAQSLKVEFIYGIGNSIHSHIKKHFIYLPSHHKLSFDYDSLWKSLGGTNSLDGWYNIPLQQERRSYENMKSNKRAMYRYRYAMLDNVSEQVRSTFQLLKYDKKMYFIEYQ
jgi:uncharacterized protein VirK/YbjX